MTAKAGERRYIDLLGVRLGLVLGLALLPIGLITGIQSADLIANARSHSEAALVGETLGALRPGVAAVMQAQGAAAALAGLVTTGGQDCLSILRDTVDEGGFASAALYAADGRVLCTTDASRNSLPLLPALLRAGAKGHSSIAIVGQGASAQLAVIHPATDSGGRIRGLISITLPPLRPAVSDNPDLTLLLFDHAGLRLPFADRTTVDPTLPAERDLADLAALEKPRTAFTASATAGEVRTYALVELVDGELYALGSWPQEKASFSVLRSLPPLILPALMWAVSLVAAWFAAETLVTRHIRRLRRAILDFAGGNRIIRPLPMQGAPQEIRDTAEAFARMTASILRDEAELEDALHGKEVLLREVHHRVKNNLQLIASIVNMQIRRTRSEEARRMMRSLQERMLSLATIHNGLFQTSEVADIQVDQLFPGIVDQLARASMAQGRGVRMTTHFDSFTLPLDHAVPLALLMTEALSNALRFARSDTDQPAVSLTLMEEKDGTAVLEITNDTAGNDGLGEDDPSEMVGIGSQLLRGFARQLGGKMHREYSQGQCRLRFWFSPKGANAPA